MDLQFGHYLLKRAGRLVLCPEGPVHLSARSFDILALLPSMPDETVSTTDLFDAVWPNAVVEENSLQVHISALRKVLPPGSIMTVHGRGHKGATNMQDRVRRKSAEAATVPRRILRHRPNQTTSWQQAGARRASLHQLV